MTYDWKSIYINIPISIHPRSKDVFGDGMKPDLAFTNALCWSLHGGATPTLSFWPLQTNCGIEATKIRGASSIEPGFVYVYVYIYIYYIHIYIYYTYVYPMTDPWCCYIWCAMDPIKKNPLLVSINIAAPAGSYGSNLKISAPEAVESEKGLIRSSRFF